MYEVAWVGIKDKPGNSKTLYLGSSTELDEALNFSTITINGGVDDYDSPVITSISVDKTSVDVRNGHQIVTFDIVATDPSGLGRIQMHLRNKKSDGTLGTGSKDVVYDWTFGDELGGLRMAPLEINVKFGR